MSVPWGLKCERIPRRRAARVLLLLNMKATADRTLCRSIRRRSSVEIAMPDFLRLANRRTTRPIASTRSLNWSVPAQRAETQRTQNSP